MSYVQSNSVTIGGASASAAFLSGDNVAGNTILVLVMGSHQFAFGPFDPGFTFAVSDTQGNTYTQIGTNTVTFNASNGVGDQVGFIASNINAGPNTVSVLVSGGSSFVSVTTMTISEYHGNVAVSPLTAFNNITQFTGDVSVTLSTSQPNEVVALFFQDSAPLSVTPPAGFATRGGTIGLYDKVIAGTGLATYTFLVGGGSGEAVWAFALRDVPGVATSNRGYVYIM